MSRAGTDPQASPDRAPGQRRGGAERTVDETAANAGPEAAEQAKTPRAWESVLRIAGVVVAIVAAFVSGVFELLLSTFRAGDVASVWSGDAIGSGDGPPIGLSIVVAVVLNYGIAWFAVTATGRRWALGPPWALWTLLMLFAAGVRTREGDYLLTGDNWVALVMILFGSLTYAVYAYRMIMKRIPR
jgi:hypothetical protein